MNAFPGSGGSARDHLRYVITSRPVDLTHWPDVQFSGTLTVTDTCQVIDDTFSSHFSFSSNAADLISWHDLLTPDGILSGAELAARAGLHLHSGHVIPAERCDIQQIVIEGNQQFRRGFFTVRWIKVRSGPSQLQATPDRSFSIIRAPNPATRSRGIFITQLSQVSTSWTLTGTPAGLLRGRQARDLRAFRFLLAPARSLLPTWAR
jgi:hypothetical protein